MKRIAVATTTRADWGLLSPLCRSLKERGAEVLILAAGMHYEESMGLTYREIESDGFEIAAGIRTPGSPAQEAAQCLEAYASILGDLGADCIICLGDRFEMLAIAMAATLQRVPIVHIAGGAVSEGAFDDAFRHAITKLSSLHLTETPGYRARVISMGEDPARVIHTGAIGVHNILGTRAMPKDELEESIGFRLEEKTLLCTMHAATMDSMPATRQLRELLDAFESRKDLRVLFTHPNNDTDPRPLIGMLNEFAASAPERYRVIPSLGRVRYISVLHHVEGVAGNSSGGIVEVPSMGIPTLDIGIRQRGRDHGPGVIHCDCSAESIREGLQRALSAEQKAIAAKRINPYYKPDTLQLMTERILSTDFSTCLPKRMFQNRL